MSNSCNNEQDTVTYYVRVIDSDKQAIGLDTLYPSRNDIANMKTIEITYVRFWGFCCACRPKGDFNSH